MTRNTKPAAPAPAPMDPDELLLQALAAMGATKSASANTEPEVLEVLCQPLSARDEDALERMGWAGRLTAPRPTQPPAKAKKKSGPVINAARFSELTPARQASSQFWAGLCSTIARNGGKVWLPEIAAVAATLGVEVASPAQLSARLAALIGRPVARPEGEKLGGFLVVSDLPEMNGAQLWAQLWARRVQAFTPQTFTPQTFTPSEIAKA